MNLIAFSRRGIWLFAGALVFQAGHMVEHIAQLYQYLILWYPITEAHGIIFFLDLEWNHFTFNFFYLLALFWAAWELHLLAALRGRKTLLVIFVAGAVTQIFHTLEHTARIGQFLQTACTPCQGIAGWFVNGIYLHFGLNAIALVFPAIVFFGLGLHRQITLRKPSSSSS
jgi:hypothetical protein